MPSPLSLRASAVKAEVRDVENLRLKLEAKENDIIELRKALKQKVLFLFLIFWVKLQFESVVVYF